MYFMNEDDLDRACVERCLRGEADAFEEILDRYERPLYNAIYRLTGNVEEARDLCQQAFLKAFEHLGSYDSSRKFFSWIYRVAMNETINYMNSRRKWEPLDESLPYMHASPEEEVQAMESQHEIQQALLALEINYRLALIVRHFLDLSYAEASDVLDVPEKTVKSRLFTARQLLREILEGQRHVVH
jgi:RNA polymerase sigma-70 factor, ECF subfamily